MPLGEKQAHNIPADVYTFSSPPSTSSLNMDEKKKKVCETRWGGEELFESSS